MGKTARNNGNTALLVEDNDTAGRMNAAIEADRLEIAAALLAAAEETADEVTDASPVEAEPLWEYPTPETTPSASAPVKGLVMDEAALLALIGAAREFASSYWCVVFNGPDKLERLVGRYLNNQQAAAQVCLARWEAAAEGTGGGFAVVKRSDDPNRTVGMVCGEATLTKLLETYRSRKDIIIKLVFVGPDASETIIGEWSIADEATATEKLAELRPLQAGTRGKFLLTHWLNGDPIQLTGAKEKAEKKAGKALSSDDDTLTTEQRQKKRDSAKLWRLNLARREAHLPKYATLAEAEAAGA